MGVRINRSGQLTLCPQNTTIGYQRHPFPRAARFRVQITRFLEDVTNGLRVCHPQTILLHAPMISVKNSNTNHRRIFSKNMTYPQRTIPTNDIPEILEEPLLRHSSIFGQKIPLVSLKVFALSALDPQEKVKWARLTLHGRTENPRWVRWSWYILDRRKPPVSSKKDVNEECCTSRECSELVLHGHGQFAVRSFALGESEEGRGLYRLTSGPVSHHRLFRTRRNPPEAAIERSLIIKGRGPLEHWSVACCALCASRSRSRM